ncbi:MAG TPA: YihY/virulence factor BrkB family protein [Ferrovibrio sp.]|uniref:YihY/virulence factor BrkB family protein n=1 Tax=Ferrovibrio sp. TaxID=1917215 RepID=UPI002B4ACC62|nr:YihY/virulence factor BrkB family protein [Ferrovibrio sp.]HLT76805.1 YihY/virulence factor BrkB family protein [Ferrovibrio sp.]
MSLRADEPGGWPAGPAQGAPLWAMAIAVILLASGFNARPAGGRVVHWKRSGEAGRGREAASPAEIPKRGWKDVLLRVKDAMSENRLAAVSAGIAFYTLLALFPAIAAVVSLYGLFADPGTVDDHLESLGSFIPASGMDLIRAQVEHVTAQGQQALGLTFIIGLAGSLWTANAGTKALFDALNVVYGEREQRNFFKLTALSLVFTLGSIAFLVCAMGALVVLPAVLTFVGLGGAAEFILKLFRWPFLFAGIVFALAMIYRYGPSREKPKWRWVTWGSTLAALLWVAVSVLFSWYAENFGNYNKTYGSLGAVIIFMTWIWISALAVLLGAQLDAELEHQTARDTTTGSPKPLGQRGATMADTVGRAASD